MFWLPQDVFKPEPARLRKQVSAIINFARHREHKLAFWADITEQTQLAADEAAEVEDAKRKAVSAHQCWNSFAPSGY